MLAPGTLNVTSALAVTKAVVSFCDIAAVNGFHPLSEDHSQLTSALLLFTPSSPLNEEFEAALAVKKYSAYNCEWVYNQLIFVRTRLLG